MPSLSNSAKELWPRKARAEFLSTERLFLSSLFAWKRNKQSPQCINKDCFSKWMLSFSKCRFQNIPKIDTAWNGPLLQWLGAQLPKAEKPTTQLGDGRPYKRIAKIHLQMLACHPLGGVFQHPPQVFSEGTSIKEAADQIETLEADIEAATSEAARPLGSTLSFVGESWSWRSKLGSNILSRKPSINHP